MGKKSTPKIPESYDLEELLKYNTDLNRFDSYNPWGSQTWSEGADGQWAMTQSVAPEMQGLLDQQMDFVNQGSNRRQTPQPLSDMYQALMDKRSKLSGATPGYSPDVPGSSAAPQGMMPGQEGGPTGEDVAAAGMMPGHAGQAPEGEDWKQRLAGAMQGMNEGQGFAVGQRGYGAGSALGAAMPAIRAAIDKYKARQ